VIILKLILVNVKKTTVLVTFLLISDFTYQEIDRVINDAIDHLMEAKFDKETRTWWLGDNSYTLGE